MLDLTMQEKEIKFDLYFRSYTNNNSTWIKDLNIEKKYNS